MQLMQAGVHASLHAAGSGQPSRPGAGATKRQRPSTHSDCRQSGVTPSAHVVHAPSSWHSASRLQGQVGGNTRQLPSTQRAA